MKRKPKSGTAKRWMILSAALLFLVAAYQVILRRFPEDNKRIRSRIRENVTQWRPELAGEMAARYGLKPADGQEGLIPSEASIGTVVLVHGLDDPGKVWNYLIPVLSEAGYRVWVLSYPNDQPVAESAGYFFEEMKALRGRGVQTASIVAHSMGGLVAREMLTCPGLSYDRAAAEARVPKISALVMVATPNHGSELASFRMLGEFREQIYGFLKGDYVWMQGLLDGAGEAGVDLLPGSSFLEELNGRPHPSGMKMAVITGVLTATTGDDIERFTGRMRRSVPEDMQDAVDALGRLLTSMSDGLGDGLVTVDSARLEGHPLHVVGGNHLSIIRNVVESNGRQPPAIPVIMEYLEKSH